MSEKELPIILLHNIDLTWDAPDLKNAVKEVNILEREVLKQGHTVKNTPLFDGNLRLLLSEIDPEKHIVLNWCEGIPGKPRSEAAVVKALASMNFIYTGSEADVIEKSWDKPKIKKILEENKISTPRWKIYDKDFCPEWNTFPAIVKPALEHCSYGVTGESVVMERAQLEKRVRFVLENFNGPALVEEFIDGREFHVSVWGNGKIEMLPPVEMDFTKCANFRERLCTYDSKFDPESNLYNKIELVVPAALTEEENKELETVAKQAYRASGCRDYARLDIRSLNGTFFVLDINPNPDISYETSMAYAAEKAGYSYGAMISRLIHFACLRHPRFSKC